MYRVIVFCAFIVAFTVSASDLIVSDSTIGYTQDYIGTIEGGHFDIDDLLDCGINSIRLYADMVRLEWQDDDGVYGLPSIDEIKADSLSGFSNTIPWDIWDSILTNPYYWWTGISFDGILSQCAANNIEVVLGLRPVDPEGRPLWAPRSPYDTSDWNEWWEYCFALAYWCNVRHNYDIKHFQIHNEPDLPSQGWDGTVSEYVDLVRCGAEAIKFASDFSGVETFIHAPVVSNEGSLYLSHTISEADSLVDVVDYHKFTFDHIDAAKTVYSSIVNNDNDGKIEPLWISEWGTYSGSYNTLSMAIRMADALFDFSLFDTLIGTHCLGTSQFLMWDWGGFDGLVNSDSSKNETYYAFRLCCRALQGRKDILGTEYDGDGRIMVTGGINSICIIGLNINDTVFADLSTTEIVEGKAYYYIYDEAYKDSLLDTLLIKNGNFKFFCPESGAVCIKIVREVGVEEDENSELVAAGFSLRCYPNPFRTTMAITLSGYHAIGNTSGGKPMTNDQCPMTISIYDLTGRLIRTFNLCNRNKSVQSVVWDGKDKKGMPLPSGIYFIRLEGDGGEITGKALKIGMR